VQVPQSTEQWEEVSADFERLWNYPHCIGALDGKRILLQAPVNSGSYFYDYKQQFSLILMALVDAHYRFLYVDVGANGRQSDGSVFANCRLSSALERNILNVPTGRPLPGTDTFAPFVVVADDAFPMKPYLLKPYPSRLYNDTDSRFFNYRLSRARRIVENAFGILSSRWRVLRGRISLCPEKAEKVVLACCALHNYLRSRSASQYLSAELVDRENNEDHEMVSGSWRQERHTTSSWLPIVAQGNRGHSVEAKEVRDSFGAYFCGAGQVPWQLRMI